MSDLHRDPAADWALASAYVDDDVDAVQRAHVEADADLMTMVQRLTAVRRALADPVTVPDEQRRTAVAAAMAAAERVTESDQNARSETVVPLARRSHRARWFGGAAAAAIVAVLVGLAVRDGSGSGGVQTASEAVATTGAGLAQAATPAGAAAGATEAAADAGAAATPAGAAGGAAATAPAATGAEPAAPVAVAELVTIDRPEQLLDLPLTVTPPTTAVAPPLTLAVPTTAAATTTASAAPGDSATTLEAADATAASRAAADTAGSALACVQGGEILLAVITYRGTPAVATLDAQAHVRRARAITGCTILAEVADPS